MNPRKIFSYNLYMITGMLMFYMGGFILYPTENKVYGTVFLAAGVVIFLSVSKKLFAVCLG